MSDQGNAGIPGPDDGSNRPDEEALLKFLAQFGLTPGPDGRLDIEALMGRMQSMMSAFTSQLASHGPSDESGMNWQFTKDIARKVTAADGADPTPLAAQHAAVRDASALADLWLDEQIAFPAVARPAAAWSRAEWVENTFATWQQLTRPVVTHLSAALGGLLDRQGTEDPAAGMMQPMIRAAAGGMFAAQVGQSLGRLATEAVSGGDIGLPLTRTPQVALLPTNIAQFSDGLDVDASDVLLFLALRETARQRLFAAVGWLGPQLLALVEHYARGIAIDPDALEQAIESQISNSMTPEQIEQAGQVVAGSLFAPAVTEEQREVLGRLETLLALVEGWVDEVVEQVTRDRMPSAVALTEMMRRRRAAGGPAEAALKALVGLELRPRRMRDAANVWAATRATRGPEARDDAWDHPDLVPTAADLDDPLGYAEHGHVSQVPDDLDAELARLLDEAGGDQPGQSRG
ncbi:MAG: zinc-dependent metalloprotease [Propionicimonas sp.]